MALISATIRRAFRSLSVQFLLAGGLVMTMAAYSVGTWVTERIERGVVQNSGVSAALYLESLIPNQTRGPSEEMPLTTDARLALKKAFQEGILSERIVTYNLWSRTGEIIDSFQPSQRGQIYAVSEALSLAWAGEVAAQYETLEAQTDHPEATVGIPLLEIYVPIRDANTGEILVVIEFYQRAEALAEELLTARRDSWRLVSGIFGLSGALLFIIVHAGSLLIARQRKQLESQLLESKMLSESNDSLRKRVAQAAQRTTAQSEKIMQRIGQDLHDGVAQHLSVASLRLEGAGLDSSKDEETVKNALANAMKELRAISRGLALPDISSLDLQSCIKQAVKDHNKSFNSDAKLRDVPSVKLNANYATKLCVYRFLQESLSNAVRHAHASKIVVEIELNDYNISVAVIDNGLGFDPRKNSGLREDGGQGLLGLRDRAATLSGEISITSNLDCGTNIRLHLPILEEQI